MPSVLHAHHPFRIFFITGLITIASLGAVGYYMGPSALFLAFVLMLIEITFSFDNAIINARVLAGMSKFWQDMFMTVGMVIAVFGMRLVFPIVLVMATAGLGAGQVIDLALHHPHEYAERLTHAHPYIASFGGMFLLMLALAFFFDPGRKVLWIDVIERPMQQIGKWWIYTLISVCTLIIFTVLPWNHHPEETLLAGSVGIVLYMALGKLTDMFGDSQLKQAAGKQTLMIGLIGFLYLQVLDGSFSFDGVIGAFAVTQDVVLIAIGLGVGALWVRSLTLLMVRRHTLNMYRYLEHGAHYTIGVLGLVLLVGLFIDIPEAVAGIAGLVIVGLSITSSVIENRLEANPKRAR